MSLHVRARNADADGISTGNVVEPDADAYEEDEDARDLETQAVTGKYIEPKGGQDPEAPR